MVEDLPGVSEAELEALRLLWDLGPATVRELLTELDERRWAFTTAQTLLHRLETKGYVRRDPARRPAVYEPVVSREELLKRRLGDLARELADGSVVSMMHGLVSGRRLSADEVAAMRGMLDDLERRTKQRRRRR